MINHPNRSKALIAYHGKDAEKAAILAQLALHRQADQLVKGQYWKNGKGCAVACTIHSSDHAEYEPRFGIPQILARLEDRIFEGLPNADAQNWPESFMGAIRPGADLTMIWPRFALWLLTEELPQFAKRPPTSASLAEVGALYREWVESGKNPKRERWVVARKNAYAAYAYADAADAAYADAADAAYAAYAAYADAADAAYADAADAAYAAYAAAAYAADAADAAYAAYAAAAYAADAAYAAYAAARGKAYQRQAAKLIELLEAA